MNKKLSDKYIQQMEEVEKMEPESGHFKADSLLCELLIELGYIDLIKKYEKLDKWYS